MDCDCLQKEMVEIFLNRTLLDGELVIPLYAKGIVVFAHGSGSGLRSPRNRFVAHLLHKYHFATLLFDLLTHEEEQVVENRFNIELLTHRLIDTTCWLRGRAEVNTLPVGYFGASTGAAAALKAAAVLGDKISALVSRGGRPDLAGADLYEVKCPTLFIVGGNDKEVLALNEAALEKIKARKELAIIPGAYHLFEEDAELFDMATRSALWFAEHLTERVPKQHAALQK